MIKIKASTHFKSEDVVNYCITAIVFNARKKAQVVDLNKRKLKKVVQKERNNRRRVWKLKDSEVKCKFVERVKELVNIDA